MSLLHDKLLDIVDIIKYDILKRSLPESPKVPAHISLALHKEEGLYWVEAHDYPSLVASGETMEELREAIHDSVLTYFDVPRARAKRTIDNSTLKLPDGSVVKPKKPVWQIDIELASA